MKLIERVYLKELIDVMNTPDIKVITGVRRSGKSKLLEQFEKYINNNVENANIITINYNLLDYEEYMEYHKLNNYIKEKYNENKKTFDREINSLLKINDAYPKILIANTKHDTYQYEGIQIIDISKWLINDQI